MNRILVIQTAFLGDVILMTPVVSELKRLYPSATIDVLVKKGNESLLNNHPDISEVFVFNKTEGKWKAMRSLIRQFRKTKYDLAINLHRFASSGIITWLSGAREKYGFKKNPFSFGYTKKFDHEIGNGTHEVERNLSIIKHLGGKQLARPTLYPSQADFDKIDSFVTDEYYCLAPASVWFTKQLPKHKWIELIDRIGADKRIFLLGAPGDVGLCEEIQSASNGNNIKILAGELSLLQSAALMEKATRNFVNDSGPLHLASSVNAKVTAFFCSTVPTFGFGPLSEDSVILETTEQLDCRPCGLHGHKACPKGHFKCGEIDLSSISQAL